MLKGRTFSLTSKKTRLLILLFTIAVCVALIFYVGILNKPCKLTEIEFAMIKNHPQVGHDILKWIEFPWPIAQIVLQHHERLDGSGYPQGLSGKDIMLQARILGVADVVEAIDMIREQLKDAVDLL